MRKLLFVILSLFSAYAMACTDFLVGKKASADGANYITYNADSYGMYGHLIYLPAADHPKGSMRQIFDGDSHRYLGEIDEVAHTYAVNGYMNEFQVTVMESTWGGRPELADPNGIIDYVSLMRLALQRSKTAREAIKVMTELVDEYGYASSGESFSIGDKNELWIMEMIGKGPNEKGANWVAVLIPEDAICAHANQSRIHRIFDFKDSEMHHSEGIIDFARKKGYFNGKKADFDFSEAFAPADFGARRYCEARVWSFYNRFVDGMDQYLNNVDGFHLDDTNYMPLYMKPKRKLSRQDIMDAMRDHYENTPFALCNDPGQGNQEMPYRPTPLVWKHNGKEYFNERPISTQQTADTYIAQMRSFLPDEIGGVLWYASDEPNVVSYTPIYCNNTVVPTCYDDPTANDHTFSWNSAFWVCNWVANMTYPRYNQIFPELEKVRNMLDDMWTANQHNVEREALALYRKDPKAAQKYLNDYSISCADTMLSTWKKLGETIIVKFNDMTTKVQENGKYKMTPNGIIVTPQRPGFSDKYKQSIIDQTGDKFLIPTPKK